MELNREVLDCMKSLRRRLRDELAVDIRMSQPDAVTSMLSACLTSASEETRQLGKRLASYSDQPFETPADEPAPRFQAGRPLLVETPPPPSTSPSVLVYRGQRVHA
ncbi:hypothetical protein [Pseudomonas sp.]|uniref:hypothetical protein n=1 Tax=Pseudomonas sp. TaxID=306 RepID=UPI002C05E21F|nr:hypothetical protein [Pseudomonas sp.]